MRSVRDDYDANSDVCGDPRKTLPNAMMTVPTPILNHPSLLGEASIFSSTGKRSRFHGYAENGSTLQGGAAAIAPIEDGRTTDENRTTSEQRQTVELMPHYDAVPGTAITFEPKQPETTLESILSDRNES